jgi:hypothetical protein
MGRLENGGRSDFCRPGRHRSVLPLAALVLSLLLASNAWAGQLHVENVTLGQIAEHGFALLGRIVSRTASSRAIRVKVKKIWRGRGDQRDVRRVGSAEEDVRELSIYGGVKWTDPRKSPIDRRVPGALAFDELTVGRDVVIVQGAGFEALPADSRTLAKLDMFFSKDGIERYKKECPPEQLFVDLGDADLREPALDAMCERRLLEPRAFLALPGPELFGIAYNLSKKMERQPFNDWLLAMIAAKMDGGWRVHLAGFVLDARFEMIDKETRLAMAASLDPSDREQARSLFWFLRAEANALRKQPNSERAQELARLALKLESAGPERPGKEHDEVLRTLFGALPAENRIQLVSGLAALINVSRVASDRSERIDHRLLNLFLAEVKRAPARGYVKALSAIDLSSCPASSSNGIQRRVDLLEAGLAIAEADPSSGGAVYEALERWVRDDGIFPKAVDDKDPNRRWLDIAKRLRELHNHD